MTSIKVHAEEFNFVLFTPFPARHHNSQLVTRDLSGVSAVSRNWRRLKKNTV